MKKISLLIFCSINVAISLHGCDSLSIANEHFDARLEELYLAKEVMSNPQNRWNYTTIAQWAKESHAEYTSTEECHTECDSIVRE